MNNEEIVKRLIDSKAVNFDAIGKFVGENGAAIAKDDDPNFQILINKRVIDICIPPYLELRSIEDLKVLANIGKEIREFN